MEKAAIRGEKHYTSPAAIAGEFEENIFRGLKPAFILRFLWHG
jgi:hypothetical protein